jgi:hypothetical protein
VAAVKLIKQRWQHYTRFTNVNAINQKIRQTPEVTKIGGNIVPFHNYSILLLSVADVQLH